MLTLNLWMCKIITQMSIKLFGSTFTWYHLSFFFNSFFDINATIKVKMLKI